MPADLDALVAAHDHEALAPVLLGLGGEDLDAARRWYRRTGRKQARDHDDELARGSHGDGGTVVLLLAVALAATGDDAVRACTFTAVHGTDRSAGARLVAVLELAARRGPDWAREFVEAASQLTVRRALDVSVEVALLCVPLVAHHRLEVPGGPGYVAAWAHLAGLLHLVQRHDRWERSVVLLDDDGRAGVTDGWPQAGLGAYLNATPRLTQTLERVLEHPMALAPLLELDQPGWSLADATRAAVADGTLDREALVAAVLASYARTDRPSDQRVTTRLLAAVDLRPTDLATRIPFVLQVLATAHGAVTAALLPALLGAPLSPADLREAGSTILLRKEKAQQVVLLDRLATIGPDDPLAGAAVELWRQAGRLDDRTLSARAEAALRARGAGRDGEAEPLEGTLPVPWDDPPAREPAQPFRGAEASAAGLARLRAGAAHHPLQEARWLDLVVRYGATDLEGLRAEVAADASEPVVEPVVAAFARPWAAGRPVAVAERCEQRHGFRPLAEMLAAETLLRLGGPLTLLSTPSREDGSLTFGDLVERLRASVAAGYGPVDLLSALLRLEPTAPGRLAALDGLEVRPHDQPPGRRRWWQRRSPPAEDAVEVVRAWVEGGGVPDRVARVADGRASCPAVRLPAVPAALVDHPVLAALGAAVEVEPGTPHWERWRTTWLDPAAVLGVVPSWSEAVAADQECSVPENRASFPAWFAAMVRAPGPLGPAVHLHATRLLGGPLAQDRAGAVDVVLAAVGERRLDPALFARHSLHWSGSGLAPLARTSEAWEQVVLGGGLAFLWPTLHAVLADATTRSPRPAGLADLLRMLRPYASTIAANVPGPVWPDGVVALARSSSASKARAEARALVDSAAAVDEVA